MKEDKRLSEIIKRKKFINFWYCFDYLMIAGYSEGDALSISLNEFKEEEIYSDVAFVRMFKYVPDLLSLDFYSHNKPTEFKLGFVSEELKIKFDTFFSTYRKWLISNTHNRAQRDIEKNCQLLIFNNLSEETLKYLLAASKKYFGYEAFDIIKPTKINSLILPPNLDDLRQEMMNIVGIPAHLLGQNNARII